mmetsp:Transcript_37973/g.77285  ORF Transcript_37973/g.77285 Transcript_37973/m.77285 type:complete len:1098 (+) Transcript_37973:281-3574(+)
MSTTDEQLLTMSPADSFGAEFDNVFLSAIDDDDADARIDGVGEGGDDDDDEGGEDGGSSGGDGAESRYGQSPDPLSLSPLVELPGGGDGSYYAPSNAVHMEIQENAKLPTFNMAVDRSNAAPGLAMRGRGRTPSLGGFAGGGGSSSRPASSNKADGAAAATSTTGTAGDSVGLSDATSRDVDEIVRLSVNDVNLTELFLGADARNSQSMAYSSAGALLDSIGLGGSRIGDKLDSIIMDDAEREDAIGTAAAADSDSAAAALLGSPSSPAAPSESAAAAEASASALTDSNTADAPVGTTATGTSLISPKLPVGKGIAHSVTTSGPSSRSRTIRTGAGALQSPYGRRVPLPIPTTVGADSGAQQSSAAPLEAAGTTTGSIPPMSPDTMAAAVATAAAIATGGGGVEGEVAAAAAAMEAPGPESDSMDTSTKPATAKRKAAKEGKLSSPAEKKAAVKATVPPFPYPYPYHPGAPYAFHPGHASSNPYQQAQQAHAAKFAAAHSSSRASLTEAAKKRSQFGFGSNHVVPSVPMPISKTAAGKRQGGTKGSKRRAHAGHHKHTVPLPVPMPLPHHMSAHAAHNRKAAQAFHATPAPVPGNTGKAYERKKQRAKDARVKLNDAIDRLSVAIGLAGTQSIQRVKQLTSDSMSPPSDADRVSSCPIRTFRSTTIQNMEDMGKTAEAAKKWDRPSFVGSAVVMMQGLNAQCEALMRELVEMNRLYRDEVAKNRGGGAVGEDSMMDIVEDEKPPASGVGVDGSSKRRSVPCPNAAAVVSEGSNGETSPAAADAAVASPCKKRKLSTASSDDALSRILQTPIVCKQLVSYLDPKSLLRCQCVCSHWGKQSMFGGDGAWTDLVLARFGFANMRRWQDGDDEDQGEDIDNKSFALYRRMDESFVRPSCLYEGNVRLGHGSIPGIVCAWVTMVERSNGETLRSVRRQDHDSSSVGSSFTSLQVIELRILLQNTGAADGPIIVPDQNLTVDASTRRRGETMSEINWDERLSKKLIGMDGMMSSVSASGSSGHAAEIFRLGLFESTVLVAHIYAKSCSTTTKFRRRANSVKLLVSVKGTTVALVVPIKKAGSDIDDGSSTSSSHPVTEIQFKK